MVVKANLDELYKTAKLYKDTHKGSGAEPYLDYNYLFDFVASSSKDTENKKNGFSILELGMGIGFTSIVMHYANRDALIDTIETNGAQLLAAKKWMKELNVNNINIIQADVHKVLPYLEEQKYDLIFFDVYGPKEKFIVDFERILKPNGILYTVNSHLKSAEASYFEKLESSNVWKKIDEFNDTKIFRKENRMC